jgi:integrase
MSSLKGNPASTEAAHAASVDISGREDVHKLRGKAVGPGGVREIKERRRKTVPLPPELVAVLKKHRAAQARERLAAANAWEDHGLVWCQENGRPLDSRADWQERADILKAAGLPHHGVHAMRHSAATIALDEGVAPGRGAGAARPLRHPGDARVHPRPLAAGARRRAAPREGAFRPHCYETR